MTDNRDKEKYAKGEQHQKMFRCAACGREQKRYKSAKKCSCGGGLVKLPEEEPSRLKELRDEWRLSPVEKTLYNSMTQKNILDTQLVPDKVVCFHPTCQKTEVKECRGCKLHWCGDHMTSTLYCLACDQPYRQWNAVIALYLRALLNAVESSEG